MSETVGELKERIRVRRAEIQHCEKNIAECRVLMERCQEKYRYSLERIINDSIVFIRQNRAIITVTEQKIEEIMPVFERRKRALDAEMTDIFDENRAYSKHNKEHRFLSRIGSIQYDEAGVQNREQVIRHNEDQMLKNRQIVEHMRRDEVNRQREALAFSQPPDYPISAGTWREILGNHEDLFKMTDASAKYVTDQDDDIHAYEIANIPQRIG